MSSNGKDRGLDASHTPMAPENAHEPVPGPFVPNDGEAGGPYEWLTPQRVHPTPLRRGLAPERAAG